MKSKSEDIRRCISCGKKCWLSFPACSSGWPTSETMNVCLEGGREGHAVSGNGGRAGRKLKRGRSSDKIIVNDLAGALVELVAPFNDKGWSANLNLLGDIGDVVDRQNARAVRN